MMSALLFLLHFSIFINVLSLTPNDDKGDVSKGTSLANDEAPHRCPYHTPCEYAEYCYCDDLCLLYDDCCFGYVDGGNNTVPEPLKTAISRAPCKRGYFIRSKTAVRIIDTCPNQTKSVELTRLCLETNVWNPLSVTPVSYTRGIVFKNVYCALCHGVSNYSFWDIQVETFPLYVAFHSSFGFYTIPPLIRADKWSVLIENGCLYTFSPPSEEKPRYCQIVEKIQNYSNPLCGRYTDPVLATNWKVYRNQDCCIGDDRQCTIINCFDKKKVNNSSSLSEAPKIDSMMVMLQFLPKSVDTLQDGVGCSDASPETEPISEIMNEEDGQQRPQPILPGACLLSNLFVNTKYVETKFGNESVAKRMLETAMFALDLYLKNLVPPLNVKESTTDLIGLTRILEIDLGNGKYRKQKTAHFGVSAPNTLAEEDVMIIQRWSQRFSINMEYTEGDSTDPENTISVLPIYRPLRIVSNPYTHLRQIETYDANYVTLTKTPQELCLNLNVFDEYKPEEDVHYFRFQCTEIYTDDNKHVEIESIITYTCFSVSSLCLLFAIPIHNTFTVCKSVAGKNIQHLMISVLLSNLSFMFGVGNSQDEVSCTVFGSLIHLFFLCTFSWMSVSLVYFAHVFKKMQKFPNQSPSVSLFDTCMCLLFGYGMPLLIVIPCVFLDVFEYAEFQIGYSKNGVCFPSSFPAVVVVFLAPVSASILVNVVCLNITIGIICHESQLSMTGIGIYKAYIPVYLKLSVLSGLSWVFGVLAEVTEYIAFHYIFIISSGFLGTFVSIFFVFHTRDMPLCLQKLRGEKK